MLLKKEINLNYLENWPEHYYEIKDINERENILKSYIEKNPDSLDDQNRLQLLQKRFICLKDHKRADLFMRGWINSKTLTTENIHFFNKKRIEKEFRQCLEDLCILNYERSPILHEEWKSFSQEFILSCIDSHSYKQVAVGIGHVSDKNVAMRIAGDIDHITKKLPASFLLEEECKELHDIMVETYQQMLENGEQYWNDYCNNLR